MGCPTHGGRQADPHNEINLTDRLREIEAILEERCPVDELLRAISQVICDLETNHEPYIDAPGSAYRCTKPKAM
jgi:hypothetical protein